MLAWDIQSLIHSGGNIQQVVENSTEMIWSKKHSCDLGKKEENSGTKRGNNKQSKCHFAIFLKQSGIILENKLFLGCNLL